MLDANPIHIWTHQTKTNHFQHICNFFLSFCVFYRPDKNDAIKLFFLNNSKSKTVRMFILHALINNCTFWQSFSLITSFLCILQTRTIFQLLVIKIRSANQNNFKLSQLGDFIMPSQSWKRQLKRFFKLVCILWIWFKRTLQSWRHNIFFFNSWHRPRRRRLIFRTHITFNQFYCFANFQCDDMVFVHFTYQNSFQGLWSTKSVSFIEKNKINTCLRFYLFLRTLQISTQNTN